MSSDKMRHTISRYGITGQVTGGPTGACDNDGWDHYAMTVELQYTGRDNITRTIATPWRMGLALDIEAYKADTMTSAAVADVVASVVSDCQYNEMDFETFADEMGYDTDSRKAYATWEACRDLGRRFIAWCESQRMLDELVEAAQDY